MTIPAIPEQVEAAIVAATASARQLHEGPRREVLMQALRASLTAAQRPDTDPAMLIEALRGAMQPALVLAAEDPLGLEIASALGTALNAALTPMGSQRLDAAMPAHRRDELIAVTKGEPRVVSLARAAFSRPVEAAEVINEAELIHDLDDNNEAPPESSPRRSREPRGPWRDTEGVAPELAKVRLVSERKTLTVAGYYAAVVEQSLEAVAALARDRSHDPFAHRPSSEERILARVDAIHAVGGDCVSQILAAWSRAIDSPHAWGTWAAVLALSSIEGPDALSAVKHGLEQLHPDGISHAEQAAEALAVSRHPDRIALGHDLLVSPHPIARAVGVDVLARGDQLELDQLRRYVFDANLAVMLAALRALGRLSATDGAPVARLLERWIHFPNVAIAWRAALTLLRWGNLVPYEDVRSGGRLASILGARALEVFVLAGSSSDLAVVEAIVGRAARTPAMLSALARFGHPGVAPFLFHHLADDELADSAAEALATLFGARVAPSVSSSAPAWRRALSALAPDAGIRYRCGEPWRPSIVGTECTSGQLSRVQIELRLDELAARTLPNGPLVDLVLWTVEATPQLDALAAGARHRDGSSLSVDWG